MGYDRNVLVQPRANASADVRRLCTLLSDFNNIPMPELPNLSKDCILVQHHQSLRLLLLLVPVLRHA